MLMTITTTHRPATDLGYLLHKNPARVHSRTQSYGVAHVFYPEAGEDRCTAALYVDIDPVGLVRSSRHGVDALLTQYVNDRPYAASSLLSVAIADTFGSALGGRSKDRPELAATPIDLEFHLPSLPCRGGEAFMRSLFEPLDYSVEAKRLSLDERFPSWGDSAYFSVTLRITATLQAALSHIYVLVPVLDNNKHYWVGQDEVEKLLQKAEPWLATHPEREVIVRRYLKHRRSLANRVLERLQELDGDVEEAVEEAGNAEIVMRGDDREQALERGLSLNEQRIKVITDKVAAAGTASVIDLGCGDGKLLRSLLGVKSLDKITGVDVSHRALEIAHERLNVERLPAKLQQKLALLHGSLTYRDQRFEGFDLATVIEVVEHLDPDRLEALQRVLFEYARPRTVLMTTPNREFNARFASLPAGQMRHPDHRFEWTRQEFMDWAGQCAVRFGYAVSFEGIGEVDTELGSPTQLAIFTRDTDTGAQGTAE